jgi:acetyl esterase/lipase
VLESELMALLAADNPGLPPPDHTVAYGAGPSRYGELRLPDGVGPHPVVVLLHGGFWRHEWSLVHMSYLAVALVRHGFATWNLEYRRVGEDGGGWPGSFEDVLAGVRHISALAAHRLDPSRVVLLGGSAGGHLALWLAARHGRLPGPLRVRGVIGLAPVCDLERASMLGLGGGAADALLGGSRDLYDRASPRALLPLGCPQVLIHGTADRHVPLLESERYCAAARAAGDTVELVALQGVDHFPLINGREPAFPFVLDAVRGFVHERAFEIEAGRESAARGPHLDAALAFFFWAQRAKLPALARGDASELAHINNTAG